MKIIGDAKNSSKFYVYISEKNIEWVPNIELAKIYVNDINNPSWYGKDIYCTNENIVFDKNGLACLESDYEEEKIKLSELENLKLYILQTESFLLTELDKFAQALDYDNMLSLITWKDSTVKKYQDEAKKGLLFRDNCYNYHHEKINTIQALYDQGKLPIDLSEFYKDYVDNFPKN